MIKPAVSHELRRLFIQALLIFFSFRAVLHAYEVPLNWQDFLELWMESEEVQSNLEIFRYRETHIREQISQSYLPGFAISAHSNIENEENIAGGLNLSLSQALGTAVSAGISLSNSFSALSGDESEWKYTQSPSARASLSIAGISRSSFTSASRDAELELQYQEYERELFTINQELRALELFTQLLQEQLHLQQLQSRLSFQMSTNEAIHEMHGNGMVSTAALLLQQHGAASVQLQIQEARENISQTLYHVRAMGAHVSTGLPIDFPSYERTGTVCWFELRQHMITVRRRLAERKLFSLRRRITPVLELSASYRPNYESLFGSYSFEESWSDLRWEDVEDAVSVRISLSLGIDQGGLDPGIRTCLLELRQLESEASALRIRQMAEEEANSNTISRTENMIGILEDRIDQVEQLTMAEEERYSSGASSLWEVQNRRQEVRQMLFELENAQLDLWFQKMQSNIVTGRGFCR